MKGKIYLIPTTLGESQLSDVIPAGVQQLIERISHFIVEDIKTARRYIKRVNRDINIDDLTFYVLNKHTEVELLNGFIEPAKNGIDIGIISEAGCPAVADPGSSIVALAHQKGITVVPLVGPSSILMTLMASGFNGQQFIFHGYLPKDNAERKRKIADMERQAAFGTTQLFMETPFRNMSLLNDLMQWCQPTTLLCIATDITLPSEIIQTKTIQHWINHTPSLGKRFCMFAMGRY
jgi:16S rRNA (cytidine1402-2'-O)-methyltransferase